MAPVVHGVRTAAAAGARRLVLTNGCGGISHPAGAPVLLADHINLTGATPLVGPRFVDLTDVYSPALRDLARIDVAVQRPDQRAHVHTLVGVEVGVLARQDGRLHELGDALERHLLAVLLGVQQRHLVAAGVVDDGAGRQGLEQDRLGRRGRDRPPGLRRHVPGEPHRRCDRRATEGEHEHGARQQPDRGTGMRGGAPSEVGHSDPRIVVG